LCWNTGLGLVPCPAKCGLQELDEEGMGGLSLICGNDGCLDKHLLFASWGGVVRGSGVVESNFPSLSFLLFYNFTYYIWFKIHVYKVFPLSIIEEEEFAFHCTSSLVSFRSVLPL
jgi:hypothetical protein